MDFSLPKVRLVTPLEKRDLCSRDFSLGKTLSRRSIAAKAAGGFAAERPVIAGAGAQHQRMHIIIINLTPKHSEDMHRGIGAELQ